MEAVYLGQHRPHIERHLRHLESLAEGLKLRFVDSAQSIPTIAAQCGDAPVIIVGGNYHHLAELAQHLPALRLVQTHTAGTDWIDIQALADRGVLVSDNNGANATAVAEHTIALILELYHHVAAQLASVRAGTWQQGMDGIAAPMHTLEGKRVGLVGLGRIGSRVAKRLIGWDCNVYCFDTASLSADYLEACRAIPMSFDELLSSCDIISLHVPLNRLTRHLMSAREFALMRSDALFINTCRGGVVDETALIAALRDGHIAGAGLDVTDPEPINPDSPLLHLNNVAITPHYAARSVESGQLGSAHVAANAARVLRGQQPISIVQPI